MADADRPTFSALWHRVRQLTPTLRAHVQVHRQRHRGRAWHVLRDPTSGQFFRVDQSGWAFVGRLDGRRSVEEVWTDLLERDADAAPTQGEVVGLLGQLSASNLLRSDAAMDTEQLLKRSTARAVQHARGTLLNVLFFKVPLFNPDALIGWLEPVFRLVIGRVGLALWCLFLVIVSAMLLPMGDRLAASFGDAVAPSNVAWLLVVYVIAKAWHEFGHAVVLKRFGGHVPSCGMMLLVMAPSPYVDASAAWSLASKWQRAAVGAAGMIFELALAGVAALVWIETAAGTLANQLAFNAMLTAGVSTVLFNANPLMRFDGYFILSDVLDLPNLMQRSFQLLKHGAVRWLYGAERPEAPAVADGRERAFLAVFGAGAIVYRLVLFAGITALLMERLFAIGVVLALWTGAVWLIGPIAKWARYLLGDAALERRRGRAIVVTLGVMGLVVGVAGLVPMQDVRSAPGVIASEARTRIYAGVAGRIAAAHAQEGDRVSRGELLFELEDDELVAQLEAARAQLAVAEGLELMAVDRSPQIADLARQRVEAQLQVVAHLTRQVDRLQVRAPHAGVVVQGDPASIVGARVEAGDSVCTVIDTERLHIDASAAQRDGAWLGTLAREQYVVEIRRVAHVEALIVGGVVHVAPAGRRDLQHSALGTQGGGQIATDSEDHSGMVAAGRRFPVRIWADGLRGAPGERVHVRFRLPRRPLLSQWSERVARIVQDKVRL